MFDSLISFLIKYKAIILFYSIIILLLIIFRKKIETQAKIIFLYRTKFGLKWMDKTVDRWRQWVILLGYIGVGVGFIGMGFIAYTLIKNLYDLFVTPATTPGVSLVLPGINVPGVGILPFWHWLIAIFLIALIHEFSHGIVARAHKVEVKNTGVVLFGPIIGAFVEPNEEKMKKEKDIVQYSIFAAGAFANIILAFIALFIMGYIAMPLQEMMVEPTGFTFDSHVNPSLPFAQAGIAPGTLITGINKETIIKFEEFSKRLEKYHPQDQITIQTPEKQYTIILTENPSDKEKPFLGIQAIHNEFKLKSAYDYGIWKLIYNFLNTITTFLRWLFLLSLGIGLFNLLPLPIVDGGRMMQTFMHKLHGQEKGEKRYRQIGLFFLAVLLLSLFFPLIIKLF